MKKYWIKFCDWYFDQAEAIKKRFKKVKLDLYDVRPMFWANLNPHPIWIEPSPFPAHREALESNGFKLIEPIKVMPFEAAWVANQFVLYIGPDRAVGLHNVKCEQFKLSDAELDVFNKTQVPLKTCDLLDDFRKRRKNDKQIFERYGTYDGNKYV